MKKILSISLFGCGLSALGLARIFKSSLKTRAAQVGRLLVFQGVWVMVRWAGPSDRIKAVYVQNATAIACDATTSPAEIDSILAQLQ